MVTTVSNNNDTTTIAEKCINYISAHPTQSHANLHGVRTRNEDFTSKSRKKTIHYFGHEVGGLHLIDILHRPPHANLTPTPPSNLPVPSPPPQSERWMDGWMERKHSKGPHPEQSGNEAQTEGPGP